MKRKESKKIKYIPFLFFVLLLLIACTTKPVIQVSTDDSGFYEKKGYVFISGTGELEGKKNYSQATAQEKAMARRAAVLDAKRNLLRNMGKAKKIREGSATYETLSGMVTDGTPVQEDIINDKKIKVTYRFLLNGENGLNKTMEMEHIDIEEK